AIERGGESVGVALAAHLASGDDVEPSALLVADGEHGSVVLRLLETFRRHAPQLPRPYPWRKSPAQLLAVDQPVGLRVAPHQRRRQQRQCGLHEETSSADHLSRLATLSARARSKVLAMRGVEFRGAALPGREQQEAILDPL